jgi:hypothetical protein
LGLRNQIKGAAVYPTVIHPATLLATASPWAAPAGRRHAGIAINV